MVQPIDQGLGREVKREMDGISMEWLEDDGNLALWEVGLGASDLRILITQWAGEAWRRVLAGDYVWKYFQRTGCLVTLDGSGDAGIKMQGVEGFKFDRPVVPDVPPEWLELDLPTDADDDQSLAMKLTRFEIESDRIREGENDFDLSSDEDDVGDENDGGEDNDSDGELDMDMDLDADADLDAVGPCRLTLSNQR